MHKHWSCSRLVLDSFNFVVLLSEYIMLPRSVEIVRALARSVMITSSQQAVLVYDNALQNSISAQAVALSLPCCSRARVESADNSDPVCPTYSVIFIDFGNREKVKATQVRPIDPALKAVPPQAHQASLVYLKVCPCYSFD